ncbi:hypothetical protein OROMI_032397 [Orobanche minor]
MASSSSSSSSYSNPPCAACKFLRRKCLPGCIFAPYFPPEEPTKFVNVHKIFGASNVSKLLNEIHPNQREDAVNSIAYEAEARLKDPVYGCVGAISVLQRQVISLQKELDAVNTEILRYANNEAIGPPYNNYPGMNSGGNGFGGRLDNGSGYLDPNTVLLSKYSVWAWNNNMNAAAGSSGERPDDQTGGDGSS